jgi:lipopolysaccharide/colanic/teichoic acid biosynthesis glycosyltransferase
VCSLCFSTTHAKPPLGIETRPAKHQEILMSITPFASTPLCDLTGARRSVYGWFKRPLDILFAFVGLVVGAPLIAIIALLIKLTSRGPVFYSQVRLGLGGRPFRLYKLRTMYQDSEALTGPCWCSAGDPRITPIGRFLRWSHTDELPQMWNILIGDMSLIGPRPERPEMVPSLEQAIPHYRERLRVLPGLTGLAQVQLAPDTDLESVRLKLAYDLCYLQHFSFWLEFRIFFATFCHVLGLPYARITHWFALPGTLVIDKRLKQHLHQKSDAEAVVVPDLQTV